ADDVGAVTLDDREARVAERDDQVVAVADGVDRIAEELVVVANDGIEEIDGAERNAAGGRVADAAAIGGVERALEPDALQRRAQGSATERETSVELHLGRTEESVAEGRGREEVAELDRIVRVRVADPLHARVSVLSPAGSALHADLARTRP